MMTQQNNNSNNNNQKQTNKEKKKKHDYTDSGTKNLIKIRLTIQLQMLNKVLTISLVS